MTIARTLGVSQVQSRPPKNKHLHDGLTAWWAPYLLSSNAADLAPTYQGSNDFICPELIQGNFGVGSANESSSPSTEYLRHGSATREPWGSYPYRSTASERGRLWEAPYSDDVVTGHYGTAMVRLDVATLDNFTVPNVLSWGGSSTGIFFGPPPGSYLGGTFAFSLISNWGGLGGGDFSSLFSAICNETFGDGATTTWGATTGSGASTQTNVYGDVVTLIGTWEYDGLITGETHLWANGEDKLATPMQRNAGGGAISHNSYGLTAGGNHFSTHNLRGGVIEVAVWDRVLGVDEIRQLSENGLALPEREDRRYWGFGATFAPEFECRGADGSVMTSGEPASVELGTDFGDVLIDSANHGAAPRINNIGNALLTFSDETWAGDVSNPFPGGIVQMPAGSTTLVQISFDVSTVGVKTGTVTLTHDDADESPFVINYRWNVVSPTQFNWESSAPTSRLRGQAIEGSNTQSATGRLRSQFVKNKPHQSLPPEGNEQ